ncbi:hypothetical protein ACS0TY_029032 [Phlomoides rotata]
MSEITYLVVRYNGEWDGDLYVGGSARVVPIRHVVKRLSILKGYVRDILVKEENSGYDFNIYSFLNVNGNSLRMEIKDDAGVETIFSSSASPEVYVSRQARNQRNYNPNSNLFQRVPPSIPFFTGSFVDLMHSFNGVNQSSKNHVGDFEDINLPSIPTESSSDDDTGREIDDLFDDASSSSGDDGSFENPNDIPHAHIPVENTFKSSRPWHIPGCSSSVPPPSVDDSYVNECPGVLSDDSTFISKHEMQTSVGYYHFLNRVEYRVKRSIFFGPAVPPKNRSFHIFNFF